MATVIIYTTSYCPFCTSAKQLLDNKKVYYTEISIDDDPVKREEMISKSGRRTVPQIFINGQPTGGCDDLYALEQKGQLDKLLQA